MPDKSITIYDINHLPDKLVLINRHVDWNTLVFSDNDVYHNGDEFAHVSEDGEVHKIVPADGGLDEEFWDSL